MEKQKGKFVAIIKMVRGAMFQGLENIAFESAQVLLLLLLRQRERERLC